MAAPPDGGGAQKPRQIIVFTDLEPDDRMAIHLIASAFERDEIRFFGTSVMHAGRKAALTRRLLDQLGLKGLPVYQGTGGTAADYPEFASNAAARTYTHEGENVLSAEELAKASAQSHSSKEAQKQLEAVLDKCEHADVLMLCPPTDFMAVLKNRPDLESHLARIYLMGGWSEAKAEDGSPLFITTYNWNMGGEASAAMLKLKKVPITLYSSHMIKPSFGGGSINRKNFPKLMELIEGLKAKLPSLVDQETAGTSWDTHLIKTIPQLANTIGDVVGHQFTPADPLLIVEMLRPDFADKRHAVSLELKLNETVPGKGYKMEIKEDPKSNITLVDHVQPKVFEECMTTLMQSLPRRIKGAAMGD